MKNCLFALCAVALTLLFLEPAEAARGGSRGGGFRGRGNNFRGGRANFGRGNFGRGFGALTVVQTYADGSMLCNDGTVLPPQANFQSNFSSFSQFNSGLPGYSLGRQPAFSEQFIQPNFGVRFGPRFGGFGPRRNFGGFGGGRRGFRR
jgi:hypothetical protein